MRSDPEAALSLPPWSTPAGQGRPTPTPASIPAERLFQGNQEIRIDHKGESYRLRITRNDKLILTK